jgi:hypothetical protein
MVGGALSDTLRIPLDKIKLNPFKCCEYSVPVIIDRGYWAKRSIIMAL